MNILQALIVLAGAGQIALVLASLAIPRALGWREQLQRLRPLTRQVFWTYAAYILATNLAFGLVSVAGSAWLVDSSPLAAAVTGFIALYWIGRLGVQFFYFDRSDAPQGRIFALGEAALVLLFLYLAAVYTWACAFNLFA